MSSNLEIMASLSRNTHTVLLSRSSCLVKHLEPSFSIQLRAFTTLESAKLKKKKPIKKTLKKVVFGDEDALSEQQAGHPGVYERKKTAQELQNVRDFTFILRPYLRKYFSSIDSVLRSTPTLIENKDVVAVFLGYRKKFDYNRSYCVTKVVEENLEANRPAYALHACRLGRENATVGMNILLTYLCKTEKFSTVFKVYNNLKKWGVPANERTYAILTHSGASFDSKMDKADVKTLLKIYQDFIEKENSPKSKLIYTNSTLNSLSKTSFPLEAYEFYKEIPTKGSFSRDTITYSTMLNLIYRLRNPAKYPDLVALRDTIWNEALSRVKSGEIKMTDKLVNSYCNSLTLSENPKTFEKIETVFKRYFEMDFSADTKTNKYEFTEVQLDTILKSALRTGNQKEVLKYYKDLDGMKSVKIDRSCLHNFLRNFAVIEDFDISIVEDLFSKVLNKTPKKEILPFNSLSIHLTWRLFTIAKSSIDISKIEEMKNSWVLDLDIPIDDLVLGGYLACYVKAIQDKAIPSLDQALEAINFTTTYLYTLTDTSATQKNPLRIARALNNMITLCRYVLKDKPALDLLNPGAYESIEKTMKECKKLEKYLEKRFPKDPVHNQKTESSNT